MRNEEAQRRKVKTAKDKVREARAGPSKRGPKEEKTEKEEAGR